MIKLYNSLLNKDMYLYTGSTFDGSIVIKDIHGEPYIISEGDEITFFVKKYKSSSESSVQITLTYEDEIMGEYPFKLSPEKTADLNGDYEYFAFIRFADGDKYQIVPHTPLKARIPCGVLSYSENKNRIIAQVPRVMSESGYVPYLNELEAYLACADSENNERPVQIRCINGKAVVLIGYININSMTQAELIDRIGLMAEYVGAEELYIAGFFHVDELPEQTDYYTAIKETFGEKFIDISAILKTPILAKDSQTVVSSIAFDILRQKPNCEDTISIIHNEYPKCIMRDNIHFNEKGCCAAAKLILKEAFHIGKL